MKYSRYFVSNILATTAVWLNISYSLPIINMDVLCSMVHHGLGNRWTSRHSTPARFDESYISWLAKWMNILTSTLEILLLGSFMALWNWLAFCSWFVAKWSSILLDLYILVIMCYQVFLLFCLIHFSDHCMWLNISSSLPNINMDEMSTMVRGTDVPLDIPLLDRLASPAPRWIYVFLF